MQQIAFVIVRGLKANIQILTFLASCFSSLHHHYHHQHRQHRHRYSKPSCFN